MNKKEAFQILQKEKTIIEKDMQRAEYLDLPFATELSQKYEAIEVALDALKTREAYWLKTRVIFDDLGNRHYDCVCSNCNNFSRTLPNHCPSCGYTMIGIRTRRGLKDEQNEHL